MDGGESLFDLSDAAMAVHVAEAADVHEDVEAEGGTGVKDAEGLVVFAAVLQAEFDDFRNARGWKAGDYVAYLTIGVVAGPVDQGGGEFDFEGFGAFDEVDYGRWRGRSSLEKLRSGLFEFGARLDQILVGLGVFDEGGGGADFAGEEGGGNSAEARFASMSGVDVATYHRDRPGMSAFALEDGIVYHTYSTYARGVDPFFGVYHWLDRAPKGRNEMGPWWRRHDEYDER